MTVQQFARLTPDQIGTFRLALSPVLPDWHQGEGAEGTAIRLFPERFRSLLFTYTGLCRSCKRNVRDLPANHTDGREWEGGGKKG